MIPKNRAYDCFLSFAFHIVSSLNFLTLFLLDILTFWVKQQHAMFEIP